MSANFTPNKGAYTELKPFRFWCQKVLPLVYDDSLSYYELLCKVVDYLNKTMEDVDTLNDDVTNLFTAYDQLQNWVNAYYESEDFEAAIDAGLDRMAEDGRLDALMTPVINEQLPGLVDDLLPEVVMTFLPDEVSSQIGGTVQTQLPGVVSNQIGPVVQTQLPGVVSNQIGGTVANQLPAVVSNQIGPVVEDKIVDPVEDWLETNVSGGSAVDRTLSILGAGADAAFTGERVKSLDKAVGYEHISDTGITTTAAPYVYDGGNIVNINSAFSDQESHTYKETILTVAADDQYCINAHKISIYGATSNYFAITYAICYKWIGDPETDIPYYVAASYNTDNTVSNEIVTIPDITIPSGQGYDPDHIYLIVLTANIQDPVYKVTDSVARESEVTELKDDLTQTNERLDDVKDDLSSVENNLYTTSDNLFDFDAINANKTPGSIGSGPDVLVSLNNWFTSNYIPVTAGEQYALIYLNTITQGAIFRIAGYSNGIMIYKTEGSTEPNPITIPEGVDHIRFYSNTANLFNNRTNTSFKKYYYHFVCFGEKTLIRRFKQEGPNNLFQFSALYTGKVTEHGVSIDETIATNGTDTVGPISIMRQGIDTGGMWTGGWHTITVNGVACPTAEQQSLDIRINGKSIVGVDGLHYGECVATVVNKLYFAQTITGADLSTATQAIQETVTYILNEKMTARIAHKYVADTRVILYYGMQAVRIGFDNILLPNNDTAFAFADMTANINLDKPEDLIQMSNNDWNYDLIVKPFGLAKYTHNSGAGSTKYGYLPVSTRKVYWALMEGTYDYTFITSGKVLVWEGVWDIYPN